MKLGQRGRYYNTHWERFFTYYGLSARGNALLCFDGETAITEYFGKEPPFGLAGGEIEVIPALPPTLPTN